MSDSKKFIRIKKNKLLAFILYRVVRNFLEKRKILPFFFNSSFWFPSTQSKREHSKSLLQNIDLNQVRLNEFLDEDLRLSDFAIYTGPSTQTSHHLNHELNISFKDFLNFSRLEETKRIIHLKGKQTNLLESVFNSITSFHKSYSLIFVYDN
ncbi:hypothetical protein LEP1GSC132_2450 [Leptospira kirschneri str. 200803703]|uniref:hypothetical protein n=1 Tax=Leptospira kirschneri TaxID=29507 RepID=UPI0002BFB27A|nr:hypothetical protein [Leptospira kirschneri]EMO67714.1 hypothetical protein LEP1GSC132_2450 [Leptospira kirschneri str. 200803703]EPG48284.1 hypothetical protein LEP1GSC049_2580 [Leptospira kirschneri serovar Cynopteri str. 3522 CT]KON79276.1 Uncharacterized protein NV38_0000094 [Leptospira kirschneri serovar Mozdok]KPZ76436.1 hypothetical protein APS47_15605 [Leptospira kirschneri serovar Mozdok]